METLKTLGVLPTFIVIGAQKCGTTALFSYLSQHPDICMSSNKEPSFFCANERWQNFQKGVDWYSSFFQRPAKAVGEASPEYTAYPYLPGVPDRMHQLLPHARLIYLVRDPIERIISEWVHNREVLGEDRSLPEILENFENKYVYRSQYHRQLSQYLRYYDLDQIMVIEQHELIDDRANTLSRVFRFVGVEDKFTSPAFQKRHYETKKRMRLTKAGKALISMPGKELIGKQFPKLRSAAGAAVRAVLCERPPALNKALLCRLSRHLADDVKQLRELTGLKLESWRV